MNEDILQAIGNTPLVRINRLNPNRNVTIYAKLEGFNPTGSIKDRIALSMIQQAETEGKLTKGKTIIESTNNRTERQLRPNVIMRKITFGNRSASGALNQAVIMSIIQTGIS